MKTAKLSNYYKLDDPDFGSRLVAWNVDSPVLKASADGVDYLEVSKDEYVLVMMWGLSQGVYDGIETNNDSTYHCILGMKLTII